MRTLPALVVITLCSTFAAEPAAEGAMPLRRAVGLIKHRVLVRHSCRRPCRSQPPPFSEKECKLKELIDRGEALREKGDFDGAIAVFDKAIELDLGCAKAYTRRGYVFGKKGDFDRAIADLTEAIRLDPKYADAFALRGHAYAITGDSARAFEDSSEAIRLDPKSARAYSIRGWIYINENEYDKAIADYSEMIRFKPEEINGFYYRAFCYAKKGQYAEVIADLDAVIARDSQDPSLFESRAAFCIMRGDYERALADFEVMLRLNPQDPAHNVENAARKALDEKALAHGERQVRQMLKDRPAMGELGEKAEMLYRWAARKFAGEDLGEPIFWNPADPLPEFPCDHQSPEPDCPGYIRIHEKYTRGPNKGTPVPFDELWRGVVFELYNITGVEDFKRIAADAAAGKISREEYITKKLKVESNAAEKTRAFYIRVYLPWAKEHGVRTNPMQWYVAVRDNPSDDLFLSHIGKDSPHWRYYGRTYDFISLKSFIQNGKTEDALKLTEEMRKRATTKEEEAQICYRSGCYFATAGNYRQALADYSEAIRLDPNNDNVYRARGGVFYMQRDFHGVIADFTKCIAINPELTDSVKPYLLYAYQNRGKASADKRDWNAAIADFTEAVRLDPNNAATFHYRGYAFACKGQYAKAIADLNETTRLDAKQVAAYLIRAGIYSLQGDLDKAVADYNEAIRIEPDTKQYAAQYLVAAYLRRAKSVVDKHDWDRAIADLKEARRLSPLVEASNDPPAYDDSASEARRKNADNPHTTVPPSYFHYTDDAVRAKAKQLNTWANGPYPNTGYPAQGIAAQPIQPEPEYRPQLIDSEFFGFDKKYRQYKPQQSLASEIVNRLIDAYRGRSAEYDSKGECDKAIADLTEVIALAPKRFDVMIDRGILFRKKGDYDKAIADFNETIRAEYFPYGAYLNRGTAYFEKGDLDAAIADFTEAILLNRYVPFMAYCRRADAYLKQGDLDAALNDATAAIQVNPKSADAYRCRGRVYRRMGETAKADLDFTDADRLGDGQ